MLSRTNKNLPKSLLDLKSQKSLSKSAWANNPWFLFSHFSPRPTSSLHRCWSAQRRGVTAIISLCYVVREEEDQSHDSAGFTHSCHAPQTSWIIPYKVIKRYKHYQHWALARFHSHLIIVNASRHASSSKLEGVEVSKKVGSCCLVVQVSNQQSHFLCKIIKILETGLQLNVSLSSSSDTWDEVIYWIARVG